MPLAPRLHSTRGASARTGQNVSMSRTGIEEATNSVASLRQQHAELARDRAARTGRSSPSTPSIASAARSSPLRQRGQPLLVGRRPRPRRRARRSAAAGIERERVRQRRRRVLPGALGVERDLAHVAQAGEPRAQRLGHGQVADAQHEVGLPATRRSRRRAAARRSARPRPRRGARRDSGSASSGQPAASANAAAASPSEARRARPALVAPGHDDAAPRRADELAQARDVGRAGGAPASAARRTYGAPPARPVASSASGSSVTSGSRSAKFRCTTPGRPSSAVA